MAYKEDKKEEDKDEPNAGEMKYVRDGSKGEGEVNTLSKPQIEENVWTWRFIYCVFRVQRALYKGIYFYMFPYFVIPLSYYIYQQE